MTFDKLKQFRQGVYTLLGNAKDALFDLMDAVLVTRSVYSFVELSVSPVFRRQWPSTWRHKKLASRQPSPLVGTERSPINGWLVFSSLSH